MRGVSAATFARATKSDRSGLQLSEESFGSILTDIVWMLYPPPKTAAQFAAVVGCSERNLELCLSGKQNWSGDAVAAIVAEVLKRHSMRNFKVAKKH